MSKIKCDGNQTCSRCRKKGIECVYEHQDNVAQSEQHLSGAQEHDLRDSTFTSNEQSKSFLSQQETPGRIIPRVNVPATIKHLNGESHERIGWVLASRIEQDDASVAPPAMQSKSDDNTKLLSQVVTKRYTELYFAKFHHRWPIIHAPTYVALLRPDLISFIPGP
jgi:hypothetical protein